MLFNFMKIEKTKWSKPFPLHPRSNEILYTCRVDKYCDSPSKFKTELQMKYGDRTRMRIVDGVEYMDFLKFDIDV